MANGKSRRNNGGNGRLRLGGITGVEERNALARHMKQASGAFSARNGNKTARRTGRVRMAGEPEYTFGCFRNSGL